MAAALVRLFCLLFCLAEFTKAGAATVTATNFDGPQSDLVSRYDGSGLSGGIL